MTNPRQRNILENVVDLCGNGVGNDGRTVWSAYTGLTQYVTHAYGRNVDCRLRGAWYGEGRRINDRAFAVALQLASWSQLILPANGLAGILYDGLHRGQLDGQRFQEFRTYERTAILRDGRIVYVAGPVSRTYVDGLRQAGCRIR